MYVTTFYSFKGGVGRTMALVNAAVELANTGRRVLVVDFDLEAPGLDTFDILHSKTQVPGIVDFVGEYMASGQAPEVDRFVGKSPDIGNQGGGLWIMPSGAHQDSYAAHFSQIDWGALYEQHDGYLLFEDLKEQWKQVLKPDYVLIDSRTGHTDTSGICTRQLPDAVAILFFPNEQNLRGLTKVVRDIRAEADGPRKKEIELHFVMSNVPDLDDEDRILDDQINAFQNQLGFKLEPMIVHRYNSLKLLNQVVFTKERPRSRLAQEYRDVVQEMVRRNVADREGALGYVEDCIGHRHERGWGPDYESLKKIDQKLQKIEDTHSSDGEVLFNLGVLREDDGQLQQAVSLFGRAIEAGYDEPEVYLRRARLRIDDGDLNGANEDALQVLQFDHVPPHLVRRAIQLTRPGSPDVVKSRAVVSLDPDERAWLVDSLKRSASSVLAQEESRNARSVLQSLLGDNDLPENERLVTREDLAVAYIENGMYSEAVDLLSHGGCSVDDMNSRSAFHYGMAMWGKDHDVVLEPFSRTVELDRSEPNPSHKDPSFLQRMAIAYWAVGEKAVALKLAHQAQETIVRTSHAAFSYWRYCIVEAGEFTMDVKEILALINGTTSLRPRFMVLTSLASAERIQSTLIKMSRWK
ncbi:MAG: AAA family ATPase [Desulfurellaceae bacterium]|nr:AAA family ATPase [Desulfurellaceae bacterium]